MKTTKTRSGFISTIRIVDVVSCGSWRSLVMRTGVGMRMGIGPTTGIGATTGIGTGMEMRMSMEMTTRTRRAMTDLTPATARGKTSSRRTKCTGGMGTYWKSRKA